MPISWPHCHVTSAVNSAIDCNQPISTYHNQLVKPVPSHKVCTPVFATRHALACYPNTRCSSELLPAGSEIPPDECMPWHAMGQRSRLPRCQPAGDVLTTALQLLWSPFWQLAVVYLNSGILVPRYPSLWPKQEWACRSRSSPIAL